ncbi:MAG TPA: lysophospholipid acyltransferase family protein [Actinomycetales bacterium]|nr:lysophospholipid acyltransferase family protein [Actinomycetales bacterium]
MADLVYPPVILTAKTAFRVLGMKFQMTGLENIPASGGVVLASNHVSYLDFIFAGLAPWEAHHRLTRFMAKDAVFKHRISGPLMRGMHHIPVDRDAGAASFRAALKALKAGEIVGVFPEATISRSFTVKEIKSGAVRMAAAAKAPILPVAVWGGQRFWTKGRPRQFPRGQTISIAVGEPMAVQTRDDMDAASAALRARLQGLLDQVQAANPATGQETPDAWWLPAHLGGTAPTPAEAQELDDAERRHRTGAGADEETVG